VHPPARRTDSRAAPVGTITEQREDDHTDERYRTHDKDDLTASH